MGEVGLMDPVAGNAVNPFQTLFSSSVARCRCDLLATTICGLPGGDSRFLRG